MKPSIVMEVDPENKEEILSIKKIANLFISFNLIIVRILLLLVWKDETKNQIVNKRIKIYYFNIIK